MTDRTDVIVVGAGPVGLDLACRLLMQGLTVKVLEKRTEPTRHSRSIGIHPPSLEALRDIGVADRLVAHGVQVADGIAHDGKKPIGRLAFDRCEPPYRFVLAIEQWQTERILEERLSELAPGALERGVEVAGISVAGDSFRVTTRNGAAYSASWLVGCDGRNSRVREIMGAGFPGKAYADTYAMGDFADSTRLGPRAGIFLTRQGLVESFPLPGGTRRWVVRTMKAVAAPSPSLVAGLVEERTGYILDPTTATMTSGFGVERRLATTMAAGHILLAGDAAHVVSPIGGQGMNLGWLDGREAARVIIEARDDPEAANILGRSYSRSRRRAASRAAGRAEFNMWFGRPSWLRPVRRVAARVMLSPPFAVTFARRFSMRGL